MNSHRDLTLRPYRSSASILSQHLTTHHKDRRRKARESVRRLRKRRSTWPIPTPDHGTSSGKPISPGLTRLSDRKVSWFHSVRDSWKERTHNTGQVSSLQALIRDQLCYSRSDRVALTAEAAKGPYASIMYCIDPWKMASNPNPNGRPLQAISTDEILSGREGSPHEREPCAVLWIRGPREPEQPCWEEYRTPKHYVIWLVGARRVMMERGSTHTAPAFLRARSCHCGYPSSEHLSWRPG